jgi:LmbE family N-acetylglucosaminyl deacetylase
MVSMNEKKCLLVVAAHPDDEILGVAGTVARLVKEGWAAYALILGTGALAREGANDADTERLRECAKLAADIVGYSEVFFESFPDNAFDTVSLLSITKLVEVYLSRLKPERIFTHYANDLNIDHQRTFQAVLTASRPCNVNAPKEFFSFETLSASEWQKADLRFHPDTYFDIASTVEKKINAMEAYDTEIRLFPHPRSGEAITALARVRGSEASRQAAEGFITIRRIIS